MTLDSADQRSQLESLDALRREVAQLTDRLTAIETAGASTPLAKSPSKPPAPVTGVSEELIGVISAAIAAISVSAPYPANQFGRWRFLGSAGASHDPSFAHIRNPARLGISRETESHH